MKKFSLLIITLICLLSCSTTVLAYSDYETNVSVFVDGTPLEMDTVPIIVNDRALVPIRAISEKLNYNVGWNNEHQLVSISNNSKNIFLQIGSQLVHVNDVEHEIDVAPLIHNNRTYVPIRFVTETLNCIVDWDEATESVLVYTNNLIKYEVYKDDTIEFTFPNTWVMASFGNIHDFNINDNEANGFLIVENKNNKTFDEYVDNVEKMVREFYFGDGDTQTTKIEKFITNTNIEGIDKLFAYKSKYATVYGLKVKTLIFEIDNKFYTFGVFTDDYSFNNYSIQLERICQDINIIK